MKYIELNPVRANMVDFPAHYRWSSYCHNSGFKKIEFIEFHQSYLALGSSDYLRSQAYKDLFKQDLSSTEIKHMRDAWQTGTPLGSDLFIEKVEVQLAKKVGQTRRGRPNKGL